MAKLIKKIITTEEIDVDYPSYLKLGEIIFAYCKDEKTVIIITDWELEHSIKVANELSANDWQPCFEVEFKTHFNNVKYKIKRACGEDC